MNEIDPLRIPRIIDAYINWKEKSEGWILVNRDNNGAQFTVPKSFNSLAVWLAVISLFTVVFWWVSIIFIVLGLIDYIFSGQGTFYKDYRQMERELRAEQRKKGKK